MNKILSIKEAMKHSKKLQDQGKRVILVGGCFDILHLGHILFLEKAKEKGEVLFVWVEPDETVRKRKGINRPIHTQQERAQVIAALACVDYVILLPHFTTNAEYDNLVKDIKPAIIAATQGDPEIVHKQRSAKTAGAQIIYVTKNIKGKSTTRLAELVAQET